MNSATQQHRPLEVQLQATLNMIPAYTWYAAPSGALTFVNERTADYLGLPKDHPLRFGIDIGGEWDAHIPMLHPDDREESRRIWSICLQTGSARESSIRIRNAEGGYRWFKLVSNHSGLAMELSYIGSGLISTLKNASKQNSTLKRGSGLDAWGAGRSALRDSITGLPSCSTFTALIRAANRQQ